MIIEKTSAKHPEPPRFSLGELINTYVTTALHDEGGKPSRAEQQVEFTFRNKCTWLKNSATLLDT